MDIQTYISSGILESYVLGLTSPEENEQIEALAEQHESIRAEIASIQSALETYATQFSQEPPASLKNKVMTALDELEAQEAAKGPFITVEKTDEKDKEENEIPLGVEQAESDAGDNMITLSATYKAGVSRYWMAAACILLGVSILANLFLFTQWKQTETQLSQAKAEQAQLALQNQQLHQTMAVVSNPDYRILNLQTTDPTRSGEVVVYWHPHNGNLYISASKLPPLPKGKIYQLWAIVDGKPVDAGLFAPGQNDLQPMKLMPMPAQAFAVTMETEKGSASPTMPIYVQASV